ncbi:TVP38/TMEM64 family protein [Halovivax limisalsi]|uniref:TVP38/TMEM64 family protein n=1 Tax=Halovivax limisalsi TaxID=1453760 RepID=UPI001FFD4862|nr:TVP38/TMEM64 family protein [Halovivax limisalsi]
MGIFSSRRDRWRALGLLCLLALAFGALYFLVREFAPFVFDADAFRSWIDGFGVLAPLVFVFVQALQVVVAPIPGQVLAFAAGYVFGPVAGTVYSLTGVLIGSAVAFSIAKRFGRGFVESILHDDVVARFDGFVDTVGIPGLLAFVLVPGLPDDAICFLAGLTKWSLRTFLLVIAVGRLPAYVFTVYAGGEFANGRITYAFAIVAIIVLASVVGYRRQETIRNVVERLELRLPL